MKFDIILTDEAKDDLSRLEKHFQKDVLSDYLLIKNDGLEYVNKRPLQKGLYEIKSGQVRSLYTYKEGQVIIIALVFLKKTQKTPAQYIDQALRRIKHYEK